MKNSKVVSIFFQVLRIFMVLCLTQVGFLNWFRTVFEKNIQHFKATVMKPTKIECEWNADLMANGSCGMKPNPGGSGGIIDVDVTFIKEAHHIWVSVDFRRVFKMLHTFLGEACGV
jgi:hypothetical protein